MSCYCISKWCRYERFDCYCFFRHCTFLDTSCTYVIQKKYSDFVTAY